MVERPVSYYAVKCERAPNSGRKKGWRLDEVAETAQLITLQEKGREDWVLN
jgi:hypothetical protein